MREHRDRSPKARGRVRGPPPDISPPSGLPGAITSSWAVKAVIMARKRPLPKYAGALAEPIYVDTVSGEPDEWIKAQVFEKMALLCTHYRIDPSENCWWQLAVSLACEHVPGLQLSFRPKRGPHPSWKAGLGLDLVRAVQRVMSETGMRTQDAVRKLQKDKPETWGLYTVPNLCARYREAKQHEEQLQKAIKRARERVAVGRPLPLDLLVDLPTDEN